MLTGRRLPASEALDLGIANRVVPGAELDGTVDELVQTLSSKSPLIAAMGKGARSTGPRTCSFEDSLDYLVDAHGLLQSEDTIEGSGPRSSRSVPPEWKESLREADQASQSGGG